MKNDFTSEQIGTVIGHARIPAGETYRDTFEVAAWHRTHAFEPGGTHPVKLYEQRYGSAPVHGYALVIDRAPTTVVDAYMATLFGGVPIGEDRSSKHEIGRKDHRPLCLARAPTLDQLNEIDLSAFDFTPIRSGDEPRIEVEPHPTPGM